MPRFPGGRVSSSMSVKKIGAPVNFRGPETAADGLV
jgi:hypothetical protein